MNRSQKYIQGVHCGVNHDGNIRLAKHSAGWVQCQGCGHLYTTREVAFAKANPSLVHAHAVMLDAQEAK